MKVNLLLTVLHNPQLLQFKDEDGSMAKRKIKFNKFPYWLTISVSCIHSNILRTTEFSSKE